MITFDATHMCLQLPLFSELLAALVTCQLRHSVVDVFVVIANVVVQIGFLGVSHRVSFVILGTMWAFQQPSFPLFFVMFLVVASELFLRVILYTNVTLLSAENRGPKL